MKKQGHKSKGIETIPHNKISKPIVGKYVFTEGKGWVFEEIEK